MTNTRGDVQRQFELLYDRISHIKHAFESCTNYDSSSNDTGSEYDTDDALDTNLITQKTYSDRIEKTDKAALGLEQPHDAEHVNGELTGLSETSLEAESGKDIGGNNGVESSNTAENISAVIPDAKETCYCEYDTEDWENCDSPHLSVTETDSTFDDAGIVSGNLDTTHEIQNANEQKLSLTHVWQTETTNDSSLASEKENHRNADQTIACTSFWKINIKPRRPLHEKYIPAMKVGEGEYVIETGMVDGGLIEQLEPSNIQSPGVDNVEDRDDKSHQNELNFINIVEGVVSFNVKSDCDCASTDSESELEFLEFVDGLVRFDVKSAGFNTDLAFTYFEYSSDDDVFSNDETFGIETLFNMELINSYSETDSILEHRSDETEESSLYGLANLFEEGLLSDNNDMSITLESHPKDTEFEAVKENKTTEILAEEEDDSVTGVSLISETQPAPNRSEARIECSFAGVVLLNALPKLLTSSLMSRFFSSPSLSFAFYKPGVLRGTSWLSTTDYSKLSFSSQELPFNKFYGLTLPGTGTHFDTLSTKSTTSTESSLKSICES